MARVGQLYGVFINDLRAHGKSEKTIDTYESHFELLKDFLPTDDIRSLRPEVLENYVNFLATHKGPRTRGDGMTPNSIHGHLSSLRSFCGWLVKRKFLDFNPAEDLEDVVRPKKLPRALPTAWVESILSAPLSVRDKALLMIMRTCGLRRSELVNLDLADLDLTEGALVVRNGKGGLDRGLPLPKDTQAAVEAWLEQRGRADGPLFIGIRGERLGQYGIGMVLHNAAARAKLPHVTPHQLRHTIATEAINAGVPLQHLQDFLGHASLSTTQKYTHVTAKELKESFTRLAAMRAARIVEEAKIEK